MASGSEEREVPKPNLKASVSPGTLFALPPPCQEPANSLRDEWLEAFDEFWKEYPRKIGKFMARKAFLRVRPWSQKQCDEIFAGLARARRYWTDHDTQPEYIPHPSTWLNQHRWEDDYDDEA